MLEPSMVKLPRAVAMPTAGAAAIPNDKLATRVSAISVCTVNRCTYISDRNAGTVDGEASARRRNAYCGRGGHSQRQAGNQSQRDQRLYRKSMHVYFRSECWNRRW